MTDVEPGEEATLFPKTAGERLRDAREGQGLSLAEIASRTRIPIRQLEAIETSNFSALPSVTYSVGFAKAYARAVGLDEVAIAREVRGQNDEGVRRTEYEAYEINDPSRNPTGGVVIISVALTALLILAVGLWYGTTWFRGEDSAPLATVVENEVVPVPVAEPTPAAPAGGQVTLVATDEVWLRVYDATKKTLFENTMKAGDRYDVPADANGPMINIGRPDKLQVLLNGSQLPPLGDGRVAIKDIGISAAVLNARVNGVSVPTPPTATPSNDTTPATASRRRTEPRSAVPGAVPTPAATLAPLLPPASAASPATAP
ncbi:helix-turn-helix domain-containing protein [Sphingomonas sp.]|uniref:helix-turn-helix domain-containing protein n=1 Tax=Sphingomonas sp. TaxID=28214 RepID=UPI003D6CF657